MNESQEEGRLVKLVTLRKKSVFFNKTVAESLFEHSNVKSSKVAIFTVLGKFRLDNSKLLTQMMNFASKESRTGIELAKEDVFAQYKTLDLENKDDEELSIVTWSQPMLINIAPQGVVAVFFLDIFPSQDNSNSEGYRRNYEKLAGLCVHLSSSALYFGKTSLQDLDWDHMAKVTAEGLRCASPKQHQKLTLLIRDWPNPEKLPYGEKGGGKALEELLSLESEQSVVSKIKNCYLQTTAYLLPSSSPDREYFQKHFTKFLEAVLGPIFLTAKQIGGDFVQGNEIVEMIRNYIDALETDDSPVELPTLEKLANPSRSSDLDEDEMFKAMQEKFFAEITENQRNRTLSEGQDIADEDESCLFKGADVTQNSECRNMLQSALASDSYVSIDKKETNPNAISFHEFLLMSNMNSKTEVQNVSSTSIEVKMMASESTQKIPMKDLPTAPVENLTISVNPLDILKKHQVKSLQAKVKEFSESSEPSTTMYDNFSEPTTFSIQLEDSDQNFISQISQKDSDDEDDVQNSKPFEIPQTRLIQPMYDTDTTMDATSESELSPTHLTQLDEIEAAEYALAVATKYFKSEMTKSGQRADAMGKVINAFKFATTDFPQNLQKDYVLKLRSALGFGLKTLHDSRPSTLQQFHSSLGLSINPIFISAMVSRNGNCYKVRNTDSSISQESFNAGIGWSNDKMTFNKLNNDFTYYSLKPLLDTSPGKKLSVNWTGEDNAFTSEDLIAKIIRRIKEISQSQYNNENIKQCTLAVPSYFNPHYRYILCSAGEMAGFEKIHLIDELSAAAIAFIMEPDIKTPNEFLILDIRAEYLNAGCFKISQGRLTFKSRSWKTLNDPNSEEEMERAFLSITSEIKKQAMFKGPRPIVITSDDAIPLRLQKKEASIGHVTIRKRNIFVRGAAMYSGLCGSDVKMQENWTMATLSPKFEDWEKLLILEFQVKQTSSGSGNLW